MKKEYKKGPLNIIKNMLSYPSLTAIGILSIFKRFVYVFNNNKKFFFICKILRALLNFDYKQLKLTQITVISGFMVI